MVIEVYLHGIDIIEWQVWEILTLVLVVAIIGGVVGYIGKIFWQHREQQKKLVPLIVDEAEYE